ncbi:MAG: RcnB family protein [Phenylobacterium sp.]|uniref:RcnB family protein n=1 Tax=Phenylobacterium sp. TaxID=1871053 RepID=UPI001B673EFA|nr:RcnB family protein [Phenylobacterium sp.]MBP7651721.1 RcnB family protein [Phenylobacterium sp.]MBP7817703.1 RcnB family protein [Phenylobacterium sp.]MBP9232230.1 RcnB family protein [Phenylobacterium sp.]MBP9755693.1 RcnB family protein [Phenylobacterium sp.]
MKTVIKGALALVLLASTAQVAFAQEDGGEHRRESRGDGSYNPAMRASSRNLPPSLRERQPAPQAQAPQAQAPQPQAQAQPQGQGPSQGRQGGRRGDSNWQSRQDQQTQQPPQNGGQRWNNGQGGRQGGQDWQGRQNNDNDDQRPNRNNDRRDDRNSGWNNNGPYNGWNNNGRDWRPDRNQQRPRFDRRYHGQNFRSQQRYRGYAYRPPSGFYIRSWSYGDQLPRGWWSTQYRLNDWWSYGLPIPPIGYEYVRVGDDVLLVDMFSGRVVQAIRDVFW